VSAFAALFSRLPFFSLEYAPTDLTVKAFLAPISMVTFAEAGLYFFLLLQGNTMAGIPALPPLAAAPPGVPAPPGAPAVPATAKDVMKARKYCRTIKQLKDSSGQGMVTRQELAQVIDYKRKVVESFGTCTFLYQLKYVLTANFSTGTPAPVPAPPAWFGPAINAALVPAINAALAPINAKLSNAQATRGDDPIMPFPNNAGAAIPAIFPQTRSTLARLSTANCNTLLAYYGLPVPAPGAANVMARRNMLRVHLGVPNPF